MAESSLEERLREHAKSFDSLLSLIPAKLYYGGDATDQWKQKKQTKAQAAEARRKKLDPDSDLNRSVKDVMDDQERKKRKRAEMNEGSEDEEWSDVDGIETEKPGEGLKKKKQKRDDEQPQISEKERHKEEKKQAKKERKAERKALREEQAAYERRSVKSGVNKIKLGQRVPKSEPTADEEAQPALEESISEYEAEPAEQFNCAALDMSDSLAANEDEKVCDSASTPVSAPESPIFDAHGTPADSTGQAPSTTTSVESTAPLSEKPKQIKVPTDTTALRARLAARIQALRDARKADGPDGKPIRTRQELIEARRVKQAERKAHKKELRQKTKLEEDRKREEALASVRNSPGGVMSSPIDLENNFAFGRVAFEDGAHLSHDLSHVLNSAKKKGPSDPKTALLKLQNEKKRLQNLDSEKRNDVEEKETWLVARKRAEGEKIRDDERLLKKAVKRKETSKKKSEKAWAERAEGVQKSMKQRQQKRDENIRKRGEEKMMGKLGKKKGGAKKKKGRAGFEGSFSVGGKKK